MKHLVALGIVLLGISGCSADVVGDDESTATASADQAIAGDKFLSGRNLATDDTALTVEIAGIGGVQRPKQLHLRLRGNNVIVGDLEIDGVGDLLFPGGTRSRGVVSVTVKRGDGAVLTIGNVSFTPGSRRDIAVLVGFTCPGGCSDHGNCVRGRCECEADWAGPTCATKTCPNQCSQNGACRFAQCFCNPGFTGPDCSQVVACSAACTEHGVCASGKCFCVAGYTGADCTIKIGG